jgi:hypothetical protein
VSTLWIEPDKKKLIQIKLLFIQSSKPSFNTNKIIIHYIYENYKQISIRSLVNLVKIKSAITFERVSELSPNIF